MPPPPASEPHVLLLNGGSSSGKSTLARALQAALPEVWLRFGVDSLIEACPPGLLSVEGLDFAPGGQVNVGPAFLAVEQRWMAGIACMAELGSRILIEDNFVSGPPAQTRWRNALSAVSVGWIGVRCAAEVAELRERSRGDRTFGMAGDQASRVHIGIHYDLEVDTAQQSLTETVTAIRRYFFDST